MYAVKLFDDPELVTRLDLDNFLQRFDSASSYISILECINEHTKKTNSSVAQISRRLMIAAARQYE